MLAGYPRCLEYTYSFSLFWKILREDSSHAFDLWGHACISFLLFIYLSFHPRRNFVQLSFHFLRMSYIQNPVQPIFNPLRISHIRNPCPADIQPSPGVSHPESCPPSFHLLRMSHIRNSIRPTFRLLRMSHIQNSVRLTFNLLRISHVRRLTPDGREGRFNFLGQTCPDPLIALTRRASATDNLDSPDSLARQSLVIRQIHFRPQ